MRRFAAFILGINAVAAWCFFALHFILAGTWSKPPKLEYYAPLAILGVVATFSAWQSWRDRVKPAVFVYYTLNLLAIALMVWRDWRAGSRSELPDILFFLHFGTFFVGLFCGPWLGASYGAVTIGVFIKSALEYDIKSDLVLNLLFAFIAFGASWFLLRLRWRLFYLEKRVSVLEGEKEKLKGETGKLRGQLDLHEKAAEVCLGYKARGR